MGSGRSRYAGGYMPPTSPYMSSMAPYGATGFPLAGSPLMGASPYMGASPLMGASPYMGASPLMGASSYMGASTPFMSSNYPYSSSTMSPLLLSSYGSPVPHGGMGYSGLGRMGYGGMGCN